VSVSKAAGIAKDGHGTSTGPDNKPTLWPVITPHCFFCPPGIDLGFMLVGLVPGIFPEGLRLPEFPDLLPKLTIGDDHNPTYTSSAAKETPTNTEKKTSSEKTTTSPTSSVSHSS